MTLSFADKKKQESLSISILGLFWKKTNYGQSTARPLALLELNTARPAAVFILALKPCVLLRLILLG
jgi:hypothetical protein